MFHYKFRLLNRTPTHSHNQMAEFKLDFAHILNTSLALPSVAAGGAVVTSVTDRTGAAPGASSARCAERWDAAQR